MKIIRKDEFELTTQDRASIRGLFELAFDGYPNGLIYYNQVPDFRLLVWDKKELSGHAGVHYRKINVGGSIFSVFGIVDLCVDPKSQNMNLGSSVLNEITELAVAHDVDFIVLTSQLDEFYLKNGFQVVYNPCRWLVIRNHESIGVFRRTLQHGLMIKKTGSSDWPEGELDFMGHMF